MTLKTLVVLALSLASPMACAAPLALVIGNESYTNLPALPACSASSGLVARKLKAAGYQITSATDLSNGATDGAITTFASQAAAAPAAPALVYICAYGAGLDSRDFILPVSAQIVRPTDLLAEGILARSLLAIGRSGRTAPLLIALDLVRDPSGILAPASGAMARAPLPEGVAVAIITETKPPSAPTEFAGALAAASASGPLPPDSFSKLAAHLSSAGSLGIAGVTDANLPASPPTPPVASPPPPETAAASLPDDDSLTEAQRRRIQIALAALGYYDGRLDGLFGPDSRAAIRRWQHEKGTTMTGKLTAEQATQLVAGQH